MVDNLKAVCQAHKSALASCADSPSKVMVEYKLDRLQARIGALRNLIEGGYQRGVIDQLSSGIAQDLGHVREAVLRAVRRPSTIIDLLGPEINSLQVSEVKEYLSITRSDLNAYRQDEVERSVAKINSAFQNRPGILPKAVNLVLVCNRWLFPCRIAQ